jgi:hypothetical protein
MRKLFLTTVLSLAVSGIALADYEEVRELSIDTRGIDMLNVESGAGSLDIVGVSGTNEITVTATIQISGRSDERAREKIQEDMTLSLETDSDTAMLKAYFDNGMWGFGNSSSIALEVRVPESLHLVVDDGSGSADISNVKGDISVDDGSGSLELVDVGGNVDVDDGSGTLSIRGVGGDLTINDGSGSIRVRGVAGSVTVDDGSGSIDVSDVEEDLIIVDDGSGSLDFDNIGGRVELES